MRSWRPPWPSSPGWSNPSPRRRVLLLRGGAVFRPGGWTPPPLPLATAASGHIISFAMKRMLIICFLSQGGGHAYPSPCVDENISANEAPGLGTGHAPGTVTGAAQDPGISRGVRRARAKGHRHLPRNRARHRGKHPSANGDRRIDCAAQPLGQPTVFVCVLNPQGVHHPVHGQLDHYYFLAVHRSSVCPSGGKIFSLGGFSS